MDTSSEISDLSFEDGARRTLHTRSRRLLPSVPASGHVQSVDRLTGELQDTNHNLRAVDNMLNQYKDVSDQQSSAIDKLRDDLSRTTTELRKEREGHSSISSSNRSLRGSDLDRYSDAERRHRRGRSRKPTSPLRDYRRNTSDEDYTGFPRSRRQYQSTRRDRKRSGSVRFYDELNASDHLHDLHQSVRDLASDHTRLESELSQEKVNRKRLEKDNRQTLRELSSSVRQAQTPVKAMPISSRVDVRLQKLEEEFRAKRRHREEKEEIGKLSSELKQALEKLQQPPVMASQHSPEATSSRHEQYELERRRFENELDSTRRKLDQTEGGRSALMQQVTELRSQLNRADEEKSKLKSKLELTRREEETNERRKRRAVEESEDRMQLEKQIQELNVQLGRASGAGELGELRRELEKSERQRAQLSDHIEVLTKDMDNKEKHVAKLIQQLRDSTDKQQNCDKQKEQLTTELEDALRRLRDVTREAQKFASELDNLDANHQDSVKKNEEVKVRAQEIVRQWKAKCKKLEREVDRHQHTSREAQIRVEQLVKENEAIRNQTTTGSQTLDNMRREMADILAIRAQQDEQITSRDIQITDLKSNQASFEMEAKDAKRVIQAMESELQSYHQRLLMASEDKSKLEEEIASSQAAHRLAQDQCQQLQHQLKEQDFHCNQLSSQCTSSESQNQELKNMIQDMKRKLNESKRNESLANKEIDSLAKQVQELKESHTSTVDSLHKQMDSNIHSLRQQLEASKASEEKTKQDYLRKLKREQVERDAELQALNLQLSDEKSALKLTRRQEEKYKAEAEKIHEEVNRLELENTKIRQKYQRLRQELESRTVSADEDHGRVRILEEELQLSQDSLKKVEREQQNLLHSVGLEIDTVIELAAVDAKDKYETMSPVKALSTNRRKWLSKAQDKLQWLRTNIRERQQCEIKLRRDVKDSIRNGQTDKELLVTEINRQKNIAEQLATKVEVLGEQDRQKTEEVAVMQEEVHDLSEQLETERLQAFNLSMEMENEKQEILQQVNRLHESDQERAKIHERYSKLQDTVSALKQELNDAAKMHKDKRNERLDADLHSARMASISPPRKRHVRSTPPTRDKDIFPKNLGTYASIGKLDLNISDLDPPLLSSRELSPLTGEGDFTSKHRRTTSGILRTKSDYGVKETKAAVRFSPSTYNDRDRVTSERMSHNYLDLSIDRSLLDSPQDRRSRRTFSSSTKEGKTPPPLSLSDDEFKKKFIPKTPRLSDEDEY